MPEVKYLQHGDKSIFVMDFTGITDYRILPGLVNDSIRLVQSAKDRRSVLALVDLNRTRVNNEVISSLKRLSRNNGPFIRAIAFVGLSKTWSLLLSVLLRAAGKRNHRVIQERGQAVEWLMLQ
jgi:hypothetical protein